MNVGRARTLAEWRLSRRVEILQSPLEDQPKHYGVWHEEDLGDHSQRDQWHFLRRAHRPGRRIRSCR